MYKSRGLKISIKICIIRPKSSKNKIKSNSQRKDCGYMFATGIYKNKNIQSNKQTLERPL